MYMRAKLQGNLKDKIPGNSIKTIKSSFSGMRRFRTSSLNNAALFQTWDLGDFEIKISAAKQIRHYSSRNRRGAFPPPILDSSSFADRLKFRLISENIPRGATNVIPFPS